MFKKNQTKVLLIVFALLLSSGSYFYRTYFNAQNTATTVPSTYFVKHPIYGTISITEPLEIELINCPTMLRLKKIHQYGATYYGGLPYFYSRYDHSIGVYFLLKQFNCTQKEQVAGMLHDASHTAFSHVAEVVFKYHNPLHSYQDTIHQSFLEQQGLDTILSKYNLTIKDVIHKDTEKTGPDSSSFMALEQDLPDLCADRIDYILEGGFYEQQVTREEIQAILKTLRFENNHWFFVDVASAEKFSTLSLYLTENVFSGILNDATYHWLSLALLKAFELNIVTKEEFCTSFDEAIWKKLEASNNPFISEMLHKIINWQQYCMRGTPESFDLHTKSKFRGVDPLVLVEGKFSHLTELSPSYAQAYYATKKRMGLGSYVSFTKQQSLETYK